MQACVGSVNMAHALSLPFCVARAHCYKHNVELAVCELSWRTQLSRGSPLVRAYARTQAKVRSSRVQSRSAHRQASLDRLYLWCSLSIRLLLVRADVRAITVAVSCRVAPTSTTFALPHKCVN